MRQHSQEQVAAAAPMASGPQGRAEVALQHGKDRLNLQPFVVRLLIETRPHQPAVFVRGPSVGVFAGPAMPRGNGGADAVLLAQQAMVVGRIKPRVGQEVKDPLPGRQLLHHALQLIDIRRRSVLATAARMAWVAQLTISISLP